MVYESEAQIEADAASANDKSGVTHLQQMVQLLHEQVAVLEKSLEFYKNERAEERWRADSESTRAYRAESIIRAAKDVPWPADEPTEEQSWERYGRALEAILSRLAYGEQGRSNRC